MPRQKPTQSSFIVVDVIDDSPKTLNTFNTFLQQAHKVSGRGNRTDTQGISELISALQHVRKGTDRIKVKHLNIAELSHPKIITALENLGLFNGVLTKEELKKFKQTKILPANRSREIKNAYSYSMKKAVSYL